MRTIWKVAALAVVSGCVLAGGVQAQPKSEDVGAGLDFLHEKRREGGRLCMSDHFHSGSASGQPSKQLAISSAIRDWAGFTAWEYGSPWGSWSLAASKTTTCDEGSGGWSCTVEARPCRRGR